MKLSIVTCTYNSEKYIQQCLDSISSQDLSNGEIEHIFVDGGSTDMTLSILQTYKANVTYDVFVIHREKKGIYNAFNEGIKQSSGDYIMILNSDDYMIDNIGKQYMDFIKDTGYKDLYFGKLKIYNDISKHMRNKISDFLIIFGLNKYLLGLTTYISQPTVIEKKKLFDTHGYFDENLKIISDLKHYIHLSGKIDYQYFPRYVSIFREHDNSASSGGSNNSIAIRELYNYFSTIYPLFWKKICIFIAKFYYR